MLSRIRTYFLFASSLLVLSCQDEGEDLLPPEERVATAIANLRNDLVAPANGWKLDYRPTEDAGSFLMILKFTQDGLVNIKSDVADEGGRYFDETTPYRIDNALSLELIFETYGVFHYLFEQEQATFGAEFEFAYKMKDGDNLVFESLSDGANPTKITLEPATATDENLFSREIAGNLSFYEGLTPIIFGGFPPSQQIILNDHGISVFWSIDTKKRNISAELASAGTTPNTVVTNGAITLDHSTGYALRNGKVILDEALTFTLSGQSFTISELLLTTFDLTGPTLCSTSADNTNPRYEGQVAGLGSMTMLNSLYSSRGIGFQPNVFTVNVQFVFDGEGNSLSLDGIIQERFPTASGFVFFYGVALNNPDIPIYSVGLIMDDGEIYVREFAATTTKTNLVEISFIENYYYSGSTPPGTDQDIKDITDEIFAGGQVYVFELPASGITVWRFFNPCNKYEVFLVE